MNAIAILLVPVKLAGGVTISEFTAHLRNFIILAIVVILAELVAPDPHVSFIVESKRVSVPISVDLNDCNFLRELHLPEWMPNFVLITLIKLTDTHGLDHSTLVPVDEFASRPHLFGS